VTVHPTTLADGQTTVTEPDSFLAQYDDIGAAYDSVVQGPLERWCVPYMVDRAVGDVDGLTLLDLACGIGQFTRRFRRAGARHVVGVDISAEMVTVARQMESAEPLGIQYRVGDAAALPVIGSFDLATGVFLLNYAATASELESMLRSVASNLGPGGRLVALTVNPGFRFDGPNMTKYGYTWVDDGPAGDGRLFTVIAHTPAGDISFKNYQLGRDHYEHALSKAGFSRHAWDSARIPEAAIREHGSAYWQDVVDNPPFAMLYAYKGLAL
jgi:SAM-dependent methyltransferase